MKAPVGAYVRIYYDGAELLPGSYLATPTGRLYEVVAVRVQQRGAHVGRQHLVCRVAAARAGEGRVHPLRWYPRTRRPRAAVSSRGLRPSRAGEAAPLDTGGREG